MRKTTLVLTLLMISTAGLLSGCDRADPAESADNRARLADLELENTIKATLKNDPRLRNLNLDVDANADRNEATISGEVMNQKTRALAIETVRGAHAGVTINDKIAVKWRELSRAEFTEELAQADRERAKERGESVGDSFDDAWIHSNIVTKLLSDPDALLRQINVDVNYNVVTLRGAVNNEEAKAEAERMASQTAGVKRVINQLKVDKTA
ncbi:MAG: BON domain-containing protein [Blastocatellia bacterium]